MEGDKHTIAQTDQQIHLDKGTSDDHTYFQSFHSMYRASQADCTDMEDEQGEQLLSEWKSFQGVDFGNEKLKNRRKDLSMDEDGLDVQLKRRNNNVDKFVLFEDFDNQTDGLQQSYSLGNDSSGVMHSLDSLHGGKCGEHSYHNVTQWSDIEEKESKDSLNSLEYVIATHTRESYPSVSDTQSRETRDSPERIMSIEQIHLKDKKDKEKKVKTRKVFR